MSVFHTSRRSFLKSGSALLALPLLESFAAPKETLKASKRMIFCGLGYGFREDTFFPDKAGAFDTMTEGMKPLERLKDEITMFKNLTNHG